VTRCYYLGYSVNFHVTQVCVTLTQNRNQGPRLLNTLDSSQEPKVSQVSLPCDSLGSIDFRDYHFRVSSPSITLLTYSFRCFLNRICFLLFIFKNFNMVAFLNFKWNWDIDLCSSSSTIVQSYSTNPKRLRKSWRKGNS